MKLAPSAYAVKSLLHASINDQISCWEQMLKHLMRSGWLISLLSSAPAYAEMNVSVADASSRQGVSASASIKITVHIRVSATFKLSSALKQIKTETNMRNSQSLILSCNNQQGRPLAHCSEPQAGQLYTLTTL